MTPKVGRLLEMLDLERLAIAEKLGLKVKTIFEHFHLSFHVPVASISEMNQRMHEQGNGGIGAPQARQGNNQKRVGEMRVPKARAEVAGEKTRSGGGK